MKNIEVKFPRKPNSFQEIQKKFHKTGQKKTPKWPPGEESLL